MTDRRDVQLHGADGDAEVVGDLLGGATIGDALQDFLLTGGQCERFGIFPDEFPDFGRE